MEKANLGLCRSALPVSQLTNKILPSAKHCISSGSREITSVRHQCCLTVSKWVKRDLCMQQMLWKDSCIRVLRVWEAWHPVHMLDPSFKNTKCVSSLLAGRIQEAENLWLMWWLSVQRMDLSHMLISMNKDSSRCGTRTANTENHLNHALGHVTGPWITLLSEHELT